ncbi:hypothetical protein ACTG9Q_24035 [Actinokineospora sp. 24-640]
MGRWTVQDDIDDTDVLTIDVRSGYLFMWTEGVFTTKNPEAARDLRRKIGLAIGEMLAHHEGPTT